MSFRHVIRKVIRNPTEFDSELKQHFDDFDRIYYIWAVYAVGILIIITALVYYFTAKWYFHIRGGKLEPHEIPENFDFTQVGFKTVTSVRNIRNQHRCSQNFFNTFSLQNDDRICIIYENFSGNKFSCLRIISPWINVLQSVKLADYTSKLLKKLRKKEPDARCCINSFQVNLFSVGASTRIWPWS